jgi:hypothetical protein
VKTIQTYFHTIQPYFYTNTTSFKYVFIAKIASKVVSTLVIVLITLGFFCNVTTTIVLAQCNKDTQNCDFNTHKSDFYTLSVIYTQIYSHRVRFSQADWDLYTHSVFATRSVILIHTNVITALTTVISTRTIVIYTQNGWLWRQRVLKRVNKQIQIKNTRSVWFIHADCDWHMHSVISTRRV